MRVSLYSSVRVRFYSDWGLPYMVNYLAARHRSCTIMGNEAIKIGDIDPIYGVSAVFSRRPFIPEARLNIMVVARAPMSFPGEEIL